MPLEPKSAPPSPSFLAQVNPFLPLLQAVLIAVIGFILTGRLDSALKERQTTVQNVDKMATLVKSINDKKTGDYEREQGVAQLAMYGSDAIFPLFVIAATPSDYSPGPAIDSLRLLAIQHRSEVCSVLVNAQSVPKSMFSNRVTTIKTLSDELHC